MKKEYLMAIITVFCWGTLAPISKLLLNNLSNMEVLGYGSGIAAVTLLIMIFVSGEWRFFKEYTFRDFLALAFWGTIGYFLYTALYNNGLTLLPAQTACILNYLWPIFTVLFSTIFLKEKLGLSKWFALGFSFLGIIVIMFQPGGQNPISMDGIIGSFSCILAAALYAFFSVMNKKRGGSQLINMFVYIGVSALIALCFCAKDGFTVPATSQIPGLLWLGIFVNAAGYSLWAMALQGSSTASIANFAYITPALSLFLSAIFLKEPVYLSSVLGLFLIIGGLFLQIFLEKRASKSKTEQS